MGQHLRIHICFDISKIASLPIFLGIMHDFSSFRRKSKDFSSSEQTLQKQEMDQSKQRRLQEAAMEGSVASLLELLQEDPQMLDRATYSLTETPLHIASLLGHSAFVKELLGQCPELANELNSHGSSPLHLAAAKGYLEIAKELVVVNPEMCSVLDQEGRSPLHLAAIKGRVGVLTDLARVKPEATKVLTSGGKSGIHLCVKYGHLEALKALVECLGRDDEFMNWRDSDGNTALHIAVGKKQLEVIKYLLASTKIDVNARNSNGLTALDLLSHGPSDLRDMEIKEQLLMEPNDLRDSEKVSSIAQSMNSQKSTTKQPAMTKQKAPDWLGRKRSALMVVASLIATVAFQAALSPPGGNWQDDLTVDSGGKPVEKPHKAGLSVMAYRLTPGYGQFMIFNTLAFLSSLSIILLLISGLPIKRRRWMWAQMVIMWTAITSLTITYAIALIHMTPDDAKGELFAVMGVSVLAWLAMMGLVFVGNVVRMVLWLLRKYGYIQEKQTEIRTEQDDNDDT